ncbi:hypothetical protein GGTG_00902 [Gaeumannomyces tritici R3-111a-1]|uniref:Uncharacterized protein n=1 Tax=Gaeumannomyces tritici (strain R3-111a-1) TaxID=644352 RepID=J3NI17_GAET3|nr:hypothetical protein GGTG_00902 [Gaeumannomyces tritici R3-111a-1]EJT80910.1 hypothetical protein GGTG_00902 [Gaeumannomyces tritici R3-111a-1]
MADEAAAREDRRVGVCMRVASGGRAREPSGTAQARAAATGTRSRPNGGSALGRLAASTVRSGEWSAAGAGLAGQAEKSRRDPWLCFLNYYAATSDFIQVVADAALGLGLGAKGLQLRLVGTSRKQIDGASDGRNGPRALWNPVPAQCLSTEAGHLGPSLIYPQENEITGARATQSIKQENLHAMFGEGARGALHVQGETQPLQASTVNDAGWPEPERKGCRRISATFPIGAQQESPRLLRNPPKHPQDPNRSRPEDASACKDAVVVHSIAGSNPIKLNSGSSRQYPALIG